MARHLFLVSDAARPCGVEHFARLAAEHMGAEAETRPLGDDWPPGDDVVLNLPMLAWKRRLLSPVLAALRARLAGRDVTLMLHEWADLALARRLSYLPLLPLATRLLFSSPEVRAQYEATPVSAATTARRGVVPIPPNFIVPRWTQPSPTSERLAVERGKGRLVVAQFGSIYPRKDPLAVLDVIAVLAARDVDVHFVFIGAFVDASVEARVTARVAELGLGERVSVTGHVESAAELYGIFAEVEVFLYALSEGLTSRRGSVLASAMSGRPVVVGAPRRPDSLAHHKLFHALLGNGSLHLVPPDSGAAALADAVQAARGVSPVPIDTAQLIDRVWRDVVAAFDA